MLLVSQLLTSFRWFSAQNVHHSPAHRSFKDNGVARFNQAYTHSRHNHYNMLAFGSKHPLFKQLCDKVVQIQSIQTFYHPFRETLS